MFLLYGVHYPLPEKEGALIEAIHKFGELVKNQSWVVFVGTFRDAEDGTIVSFAVWESRQAFQASWPELVKRAPSPEWEVKPREAYMMDSV